MQQRYPIPASTIRIETIVNRSRFIATIGYADTVAAARAFIQQIRQEMPDATHHVYAFRVGYGGSVTEGLSDDGEPAGTSGKPVMAILRGTDVGDVVIVITRYFGGTKLGTGGLVRAYSGAVKAALERLSLTEKVNTILLTLSMPYHTYAQIKRLLAEHNIGIIEETFAAAVTLQAAVPEDLLSTLTPHFQEYKVLFRCVNHNADVTI